VHVAITGIEKVVPTLEDATLLLKLLPRHATGQSISNYMSFTTGVKGPQDADGPEHFHIILLDGGRSEILASELKPILRCIRCGACMNHCPVYQTIGGHAYGWVYPGPMGSVLTPLYVGLEKAQDLPNAATLCNQCGVVCPVKIPLPDLMRKLRERQFVQRMKPWRERAGLALWAFAAQRPRLYGLLSGFGVRVLKWFGGNTTIRSLPFGGGGPAGRDLPSPEGRTFRALYAQRRG
jgi:L-lactate dehydrogenase complex protein LldF